MNELLFDRFIIEKNAKLSLLVNFLFKIPKKMSCQKRFIFANSSIKNPLKQIPSFSLWDDILNFMQYSKSYISFNNLFIYLKVFTAAEQTFAL